MANPGLLRRRFVVVAAVPLCAVVAWFIGRQLWAQSQFRAAERALNWCEYADARMKLANCLSVWPDDGKTLLLAARAANKDGDFVEANRLLIAAKQAAPDDAQLEEVLFRMRIGNIGDSEGMLKAIESQMADPQSKIILAGLIEGSFEAQQFYLSERCLELWETNFKDPWDQAQAVAWRGELALRQGAPDVAYQHLRAAVQDAPGNEQARLMLADVLMKYGPEEAMAHLEWLKNRRPDRLDVNIRIASCHRELSEYDEAIAILNDLLTRSERNVDILIEHGRVALDLQKADEAERWFRKAEAVTSERADVYLGLARSLQLAGKVEEARVYFDKLAEKQSTNQTSTEK